MKIIINKCFGGFGIKKEILKQLNLTDDDDLRTNPQLISLLEKNIDISSNWSKLKVVEIPDDITYTIEDYDGVEHIAELHRTWR